MAARRASAQFLTNFFQRSSITTSVQPFAVPREATALASRRLHSENQAKVDNEHTEEYESSKMTAEGGGNPRIDSVEEKVEEKAESVKHQAGDMKDSVTDKAESVKHQAGDVKDSVTDKVESQVEKNKDTAKDMFKDFPQKVNETATGLKEVGVEAAKSVQRDASKVAQKVGLKPEE